MGWDQVGALGTLGCLLVAVVTLIFVIKPLPWRKAALSTVSSSRGAPRKLVIFLVVVVMTAFILSGVSIWAAWHPTPPFSDEIRETIDGRTFINEEIVLDGRKYTDCTFENVSFRFDGTASFQFVHNVVRGTFRIHTENPSVLSTVLLLKGMGLLKEDVPIMKDNKKPFDAVEPPKH